MSQVWNFNQNKGTSTKHVGATGKNSGAINQTKPAGSSTSTYSYANEEWWSKYSNCHTGNTLIFTIGEGSLYAGGWTRSAKPEQGWFVIDLAGHFDAVASTGPGFENALKAVNGNKFADILSLYIKDFDIPDHKADFWVALAADVKRMLESGRSILVACEGGHGRTGLVVSILCYLLGMCGEYSADPIKYLRSIYCESAVETIKQEQYVYEMCGLTAPVYAKKVKPVCCICGIDLDARFHDDLEAEVCIDCIKKYTLTSAELTKMALDLGKNVQNELAASLAEVDKADKEVQYVPTLGDEPMPEDDLTICYGQCDYCGSNLSLHDDVEHKVCAACIAWAERQGYPLDR